MGKVASEAYWVQLTKIRDPFNELCEDVGIEIHENILRELGWDENTILSCTVRMGEKGNILVIERSPWDSSLDNDDE